MKSKRLFAALLAATTVMFIAGCASNQALKTTDGKTIVTDGKPQVDTDTGLVSYRNAETGKTEQINRDQIANMSELDN
ncbi:YgdI/YgdR family lipoprotein [Serratia marcescens]|uniref:YgdI/YgdR family lipoprotein n=1 Tax=Serratia marcescens TaxID=615 RepID=UPI003FA73736